MTQHCKANPCCGDVPCSGIPLPQDASGLPSHNARIPAASSRDPLSLGQIVDKVNAATKALGESFMAGSLAFAEELRSMAGDIGNLSESEGNVLVSVMNSKSDELAASIQKAVEAAFA